MVNTVAAIANSGSGYLGMAVQHCVRAYLGPHCILAQKQYCQKLMAQLNSTTFYKLLVKNAVTVCKITFYSCFVLTD